ncbi:hypothetical protein BB934_16895 [Microvirga ossetica]|uniref:Uncharacterized protein n=1 Tax=Microvirga ossetica TaxID=1882682 RepID=A0A1B2EI84_9HYPH|nr:hypothetical protein BB934_16895 [Microvirga ossetica]
MRALFDEDRLATLPDFFVAEVRLEAAAARFVVLEALRALEAEAFTAPRLELRDAVFLAVEREAAERAEVLRAEDFLAADLAEVFLAAVFLAVVFLAAVFRAVVFFAADFAEDRVADLAVVFFAAVFFAVAFLAVAFLAVLFFTADREADFAAVFVPAFLAEEDFELFFAVDERRALLFFAVFLVLVAPVSPVNNIVSGFLVSVGIAASFKGLRVQPSRFEGNVVIPSGFRISESVDSRALTFSVDISIATTLSACRSESRDRVQDEAVRVSPSGASRLEHVLNPCNRLSENDLFINDLAGL